ncbi:Serine/threonine-protein kinase STY17 [Hypsizygus marmoreus]|uniref:Serine/threonine-protein kinase STY17 n=1 Tax=Hypsizygus marmoreus TaxID=39966 RepID=A0A369JMS0_HYPMA|nr:Serine/threonine-protein kinase STY17 [Hypsizygus marmoreus]
MGPQDARLDPRRYRAIEDFLDIERARRRWEIKSSDLVKTKPHRIGEGSRGDVYEACFRRRKVVVKVMRGTPGERLVAEKRMVRELAVWTRLNHPNVIKFYGMTHNHTFGALPGVVSPFAEYGLMAYTSDHPGSKTRLIYETAVGVQYLHNQLIIHGDLKPDNVRVSASGVAQIIDFGMSRIHEIKGFTTGWSPNPRYMAPELLTSEDQRVRTTFRSDMYSFAMLMLQVLHGRDPMQNGMDNSWPFNDVLPNALYLLCTGVPKGRRPRQDRYRNITPAQWELLEGCWRKDPAERPSIKVVLEALPSR